MMNSSPAATISLRRGFFFGRGGVTMSGQCHDERVLDRVGAAYIPLARAKARAGSILHLSPGGQPLASIVDWSVSAGPFRP